MADYQLYCFAESGNAYKAALMLELCRLDWQSVVVDYFNGESRSTPFRSTVNEMGEVPVLVHGDQRLSQSAVILDYLAETTRKFGPKSDAERREIWRWMLFDNHKLSASLGSLRFLIRFSKTGETAITDYLRNRAVNALRVLDAHLAQNPFIIGKRATVADLSLCGYLMYGDELPLPLDASAKVLVWLDRIRSLPGWKGPYDLMPRAPAAA